MFAYPFEASRSTLKSPRLSKRTSTSNDHAIFDYGRIIFDIQRPHHSRGRHESTKLTRWFINHNIDYYRRQHWTVQFTEEECNVFLDEPYHIADNPELQTQTEDVCAWLLMSGCIEIAVHPHVSSCTLNLKAHHFWLEKLDNTISAYGFTAETCSPVRLGREASSLLIASLELTVYMKVELFRSERKGCMRRHPRTKHTHARPRTHSPSRGISFIVVKRGGRATNIASTWWQRRDPFVKNWKWGVGLTWPKDRENSSRLCRAQPSSTTEIQYIVGMRINVRNRTKGYVRPITDLNIKIRRADRYCNAHNAHQVLPKRGDHRSPSLHIVLRCRMIALIHDITVTPITPNTMLRTKPEKAGTLWLAREIRYKRRKGMM